MNLRQCGGKMAALMLLVIALVPFSAYGANTRPPQEKTRETDAVARQLLEKFAEADKGSIIVMDFQPAFGESSSFGPWLAEQLSSSLASQGQTVEVVERSKLKTALELQHLSLKDEWDVKGAVALAKSIGASTVVVGSYGAAENGIGVTLAAYRVSEYVIAQSTKLPICMVFGKIQLTQEMSEHFSLKLDSLRPKDGVYQSGLGGVSVPSCIRCPVPSMHVPDIDIQGMLRAHPQGAAVWLNFVVTDDGHTRNITVPQPVGFGFDEQYVKAAQDWQFKPAVNADNQPVPVNYVFRLSFNFAHENVQNSGGPQSTPDSADKAAPGLVETTTVTPIQGLIRAADQAARNRDYSSCAQLLEKVVSMDPNYKNAWNYLGWTYNALGQYDKAEVALRKAIGVDPRDPRAYNNLGQALTNQKKYDEAVPQYLKQIELNPKDGWAHANLGRVYTLMKQYDKAVAELETAATISPDDSSIPFNLGRAYAKLNEPEKAVIALKKSQLLQPVPFRWNAVAYEMAVEKLELPQAEKYAQSAIAATVMQMRDTSLDHLAREDSSLASRIASYWDTWGWIRFQENDLAEAEKYVKCAWLIHSLNVNGDHLGQIYEKQGLKAEAMRMYQMALAADSSAIETRERLAALAVPGAKMDTLIEEGRRLLKESRTVGIQNTHHVEGFAEFWVLLSPGPTVRGVKFISGDEELAPFVKDLEHVSYPNTFPEATELRLLRRGRLACTLSSPDCHLQMISSLNVPNEEVPVTMPSVAGDLGRVRMGENVAAAKLVKKVQPSYPIAAWQGRIQGVVRLHAIIGKDGSVMQLEVISGHPLLLEAALDAVRQWVYQPTLLEGKPVEVDTTIDVIFQLTTRN